MAKDPDTPQIIVQQLIEALNRQDIDAVMRALAGNCVIAAYGGATETVGAPAVRNIVLDLFEERPKARVNVMGRMALGAFVIQHESVARALETERRIAIYTVHNDKVSRIEFIR